MKTPESVVIYSGPSALDGAPIVVVATGLKSKSANVKTGALVQTWILRADVDPLEASRKSLDASICGNCPHRRSLKGSCYVTLHQAPLSVFRAFKRGSYGAPLNSEALADTFAGKTIRLGSYGDPAAVPLWVWEAVTSRAESWLGYTHQWAQPSVTASGLGRFCMASADSSRDRLIATSKGWRTFRVRAPSEPTMPGEFVCPASAEAGKKRTCETCGACDGSTKPTRASPVIMAHGALASRFAPALAA